ncbi:excalibur calcium-binding protein [Streptomyces sp. NPDC048389]|uniref:excalibur calcium-binding protein n=1 Tax=Streptomyces sp. NPDC048389 TaxID=3154622 RepID=UPI0034529E36
MKRRTAVACIALAFAVTAPLSGVAHAQRDLDCRDFRFQEDAQAVFEQDRSDPHRLDEDPGPDDGIACEVLPRRGIISATRAPARPTVIPSRAPASPTASPSRAPASPTVMPTRGAKGGVGGTASESSNLEIGIGLTLAVGATAGVAYMVVRRRRRT